MAKEEPATPETTKNHLEEAALDNVSVHLVDIKNVSVDLNYCYVKRKYGLIITWRHCFGNQSIALL